MKAIQTRYAFPDPELRGHYVRVAPSGVKTFAAVSRNPQGKQVWATIGAADPMQIEAARDAARDMIRRIKDGLPLSDEPEKAETFADVSDGYLAGC